MTDGSFIRYRGGLVRSFVAVGAASFIAVQVIRNAIVAEYSELRPERVAAIWPEHPAVEISEGMVQIARSARTGNAADDAAFLMISDAARKSPLSAEPFLVRGVGSRVTGDELHAAQAFEAAELRDGRSAPARYFLADHYFRVGDISSGLRETAILAHMIPNSVAALAPYLATYAQDPSNRPQVKALFRSQPEIQDRTLTVLAADSRNSDLILQLATPLPRGSAPSWPGLLIANLVKAGRFAQARAVWLATAHPTSSLGTLVYDEIFSDAGAPAPFNWTLTSSALGFAERQPAGRLHVVYDGADNGSLAWQLLLLRPGRYQLAMHVLGDLKHSASMSWKLSCIEPRKPLLDVNLAAIVQAPFAVPKGCAAQRLELFGSAPDLPQAADVTISGLSVVQQ